MSSRTFSTIDNINGDYFSTKIYGYCQTEASTQLKSISFLYRDKENSTDYYNYLIDLNNFLKDHRIINSSNNMAEADKDCVLTFPVYFLYGNTADNPTISFNRCRPDPSSTSLPCNYITSSDSVSIDSNINYKFPPKTVINMPIEYLYRYFELDDGNYTVYHDYEENPSFQIYLNPGKSEGNWNNTPLHKSNKYSFDISDGENDIYYYPKYLDTLVLIDGGNVTSRSDAVSSNASWSGTVTVNLSDYVVLHDKQYYPIALIPHGFSSTRYITTYSIYISSRNINTAEVKYYFFNDNASSSQTSTSTGFTIIWEYMNRGY